MNASKLSPSPSLQPHSRPHSSFRGCRGALLFWATSEESAIQPEKTASSRSSISVFSLKMHQSNSPVHSKLRGSTFAHGLSWSLPMERLTLHTRGLALLAEKGMAPAPSGSAPAGPPRRASHLRGPGRGRERRALQRHRHQRRGARIPRPRPRDLHLTASGPAPRSSRRAALPAPPRAARKRKRAGGRGAPQALGRRARARAEPAPVAAEELGGRSGGARRRLRAGRPASSPTGREEAAFPASTDSHSNGSTACVGKIHFIPC